MNRCTFIGLRPMFIFAGVHLFTSHSLLGRYDIYCIVIFIFSYLQLKSRIFWKRLFYYLTISLPYSCIFHNLSGRTCVYLCPPISVYLYYALHRLCLSFCFCLSVCLCLCASPGSSDPVHPTCTRSTPAVQFPNNLRWHTLVCPPLTARSLFLQPGSYIPGLLVLPSLLSTICIQGVLILHFLVSQRNIPLAICPFVCLLFQLNDEWFAVDGIGGWAQECRYIYGTSQDRRGKVASVLSIVNSIPSYQSI